MINSLFLLDRVVGVMIVRLLTISTQGIPQVLSPGLNRLGSSRASFWEGGVSPRQYPPEFRNGVNDH